MKSINFAEATHILGVSQGYLPLAVIRTDEGGTIINNSYWKLEPEEIELLSKGHVIHLGVLGGQPPMLMAISNKPVDEIPYPTNGVALGKAEEVKQVMEPDAKKEFASEGVFKEKVKCAVCEGTGFKDHERYKDGALCSDEPCRFCSGGYIDAAN